MKKILLIGTMVATLTGFSAFGQGYFLFTGSTRGVWDNFTSATGAPLLKATNNVAFLWGSGPALITGVQASVPTNAAAIGQSWNNTVAWNAILTDPNYTLAFNNTDSTLAKATSAANGAWTYAAGATFPVTGTGVQAYQVYVIGWDSKYATPQLAAAGNGALGWSSIFTYNAVASIGTPLSMTASGLTPFGVFAPVPEPATFTLAGLGTAALLIFRRRK